MQLLIALFSVQLSIVGCQCGDSDGSPLTTFSTRCRLYALDQ